MPITKNNNTPINSSRGEHQFKQTKKRNRLSLNCFNCKRKKIKCNRQQPCLSCIKSNLESKCEYQQQKWLATPNNENNGIFQIQRLNDDKINESCQNKKDEIVIPLLRNQEKQEKNVGDGDGLSQLKLLNNILKEPINNNERNEFHEFEHENIGNIESEKYLLGLFENFIKYHEHLLENLELILGIRNKIEKISQLEPLLFKFEIYLDEKYPEIKHHELINTSENEVSFSSSSLSPNKIRNYINMKMILHMIYFYYYLYYERKQLQSLSYTYLKKTLVSHINGIIPHLFKLLSHDNDLNDFRFLITPIIIMINFPILIKLNYCVYKSRYLNSNHNEDLRDDFQYKLKFAKLNKLTQIYKKITEISLSIIISKLNQKHSSEYRQEIIIKIKSYRYILERICNDNEFLSNQTKYYNTIDELSKNNEELSEIIKILEIGMKRYTELKNKKEINTNFENYEKFNEPISKQNLISEIELVSLIPSYSHSQQQQQQQEQEKQRQELLFTDWEQGFNIMSNLDIDKFWSILAQLKK